MTIDSQAIVMAKTLLGITTNSKDAVLLILGNAAEVEAKVLTKNPAVALQYELLAMMIQYKYIQQSNIGIKSQSLAGVSETYSTEYPEELRQALRSFSLVRMI
jgi:hypothetical protein